MAPEIHARRPYNGSVVDLFAAGTILFIMLSMTPPFTTAETSDPYYRQIATNKWNVFWDAHGKNKPIN